MKKDIIDKTSSCQCENCKCDPCKCGTSCICSNCKCNPCKCGASCMGSRGCCNGGNFWFWASIRIAIVVLIIVGAYVLGTKHGMIQGFDRYDRSYGGVQSGMRMHKMMEKGQLQGRNQEMIEHCQMMPEMPGCSTDETTSGSAMKCCSMMAMSGMSHDPMSMSMRDMGGMLEGKTGDALDRAFLEGMIPHHQGAVDMAKYLVNAKHPELQKMGQDIIAAQTKEIEQMKQWMKEWGYTATGSTASGMMMDHSMMMR